MKKQDWLVFAGLVLSLAFVAGVIWFSNRDNNSPSSYNYHMCHMYGYEADCKTPLK